MNTFLCTALVPVSYTIEAESLTEAARVAVEERYGMRSPDGEFIDPNLYQITHIRPMD